MSDLLTEKELLRVLDRAWKHDEPSSVFAQAYAQLVKIVEEYFSEPMQVDEDCPSKEACVYYLPGTLGPNCLYVEVDEELFTWLYKFWHSWNSSCSNELEKEGWQAWQNLKQLLTQKRTVTREWMEHKAGYLVERFSGECSLTTLQRFGIMTVLTEKGDMEDLLQELGIKVITKK